jgi:hypothetical protein
VRLEKKTSADVMEASAQKVLPKFWTLGQEGLLTSQKLISKP